MMANREAVKTLRSKKRLHFKRIQYEMGRNWEFFKVGVS